MSTNGSGRATRILLTLSLLSAGVAALAWGRRWDAHTPDGESIRAMHFRTATVLGALFMIAAPITFAMHARYYSRVQRGLAGFALGLDALQPWIRGLDLALVSILGLFLEVALIRWHGSEFRACAYFKNITLLACFLGLGLGFARAQRRVVTFPLALVLLTLQVIAMDVLGMLSADKVIRNPLSNEPLWGIPSATELLDLLIFYGFFAALFGSTIAIFIPIGQLTGRLMNPAAPLVSYTVNIAGSIIGVVLFAIISCFWWPPSIWFGIAAVMSIWLSRHSRGGLLASACAAAVMLAWLGYDPRPELINIYSPYQRLELKVDNARLPDGRLVKQGVWLAANKTYYMQGMDLSDEFVARWGDQIEAVAHKSRWYNLPYQFRPRPERVLIVGAGAGNDVAAAVRHGAERIDAVEIDPAIRWVGETYHPESPYQAAGVNAVTDDARAFMKRSPAGQYDLIVFGLLDSHTLLSGMSSIRLDNFLYTQESMVDARRLLRTGGLICLSFAAGPEGHFPARLYNMLTAAFGHTPRTFGFAGHDTMYIIGLRPDDAQTVTRHDLATDGPTQERPDMTVGAAAPRVPETTRQAAADAAARNPPPSTDDWPFPFLTGRTWRDFPKAYAYLIAMLLLISVVWVLGTTQRGTTFNGHFFFLGAAFLLIETKGITELALVFGTTWIVASVVITAILVLILIANWTVHALDPRRMHLVYAALMASLLAGCAIPVHSLLQRGWLFAAVASSVLLCLPLYFAGIIFATSLKRFSASAPYDEPETAGGPQSSALATAFASNLLGAIIGGLCEYSSMVVGFRSLYLVGMALYGLSWIALGRRPGWRLRTV